MKPQVLKHISIQTFLCLGCILPAQAQSLDYQFQMGLSKPVGEWKNEVRNGIHVGLRATQSRPLALGLDFSLNQWDTLNDRAGNRERIAALSLLPSAFFAFGESTKGRFVAHLGAGLANVNFTFGHELVIVPGTPEPQGYETQARFRSSTTRPAYQAGLGYIFAKTGPCKISLECKVQRIATSGSAVTCLPISLGLNW